MVGRALASLLLVSMSLLPAQQPAALVECLLRPAERARATVECQQLGPAAAAAIVAEMARSDARQPAMLAAVLADLGNATRGEVARLTALLPNRSEPVRTLLLRALANGVLGCADETAIDRLRGELGTWAAAGFFYSEDPAAPSFAWYEYVRLQRRLALRECRAQPAELECALESILAGRSIINLGALLGGRAAAAHDLSSYGQHATREQLEAIAELALAHGAAAKGVVAELAMYLQHERPRAGEILCEDCAGIGENAPVDLPAVKWPTLWRRDDWRFAIAQAVVAVSTQAAEREHALRHLLYAPIVADRLAALAAVRAWRQPWNGFAAELAACVEAPDRLVVRDALVTLGQAQGVALPVGSLQRLAGGGDKELAVLAKRLLAR